MDPGGTCLGLIGTEQPVADHRLRVPPASLEPSRLPITRQRLKDAKRWSSSRRQSSVDTFIRLTRLSGMISTAPSRATKNRYWELTPNRVDVRAS